MLWSQSYVAHCRVLPPGEFNDMSSQSNLSHCRVLSLGEFTVMIPEPHATLQGAVTWRNQCHDRATLQDVTISSAILKIVFRQILFHFYLFWFFNAVWALTSGGFRIVSDTLVEYASSVWSPHYTADIRTVERVQHKFTKLILGCSKLSYEV